MGPVLPVLIPEVVAVGASEGEGGDDSTVRGKNDGQPSLMFCVFLVTRAVSCSGLPFSALPITAALVAGVRVTCPSFLPSSYFSHPLLLPPRFVISRRGTGNHAARTPDVGTDLG